MLRATISLAVCVCGSSACDEFDRTVGDAGVGIVLPPDADGGSDGDADEPRRVGAEDADLGDGPGGDAIRYDVAASEDPTGCPGDGSSYDFSVVWIANSPQGTVSKIDTQTGAELARYRTGPEGTPDPSRTSVNLQGDVAVANRAGSLVKIATHPDDCNDLDGDGAIRTSTGADDVLPWGEDECVLWHADLPYAHPTRQGGPRAVAWDAGEPLDDPCEPRSARVWVGWRDVPTDDVLLWRLDGETGAVDAEVEIPEWEGRWGHGAYGGAVDGDNNFWALGTWSTLVRVDGVTLDVDRWDNDEHNAYGIALDAEGNPWLAGFDGRLTHFDVASETFVDHGHPGPGRLRGLAIDGDGYAWIAANNSCGLVQFDLATEAVVDAWIGLPGCSNPVGVSIDIDGFVWVVDRDSSIAYRVDPISHQLTTIEGLISPYTYSDMTGRALELVAPSPEG